ncbi:hypothetical protein TRVA0_019S01838 [Trichomonascus vanleenenianus]|uniref:uncharacterized protein n=1 Tax=Trichomonascus vanleenenianus TaxID=2268995 RepID=UPI003ECA8B9B
MIFKPFATFSRHASLAKNFWTSSRNPSSEPSFFVSTHQLARHQSQVAIRNSSAFNGSGPGSGDRNNAYSSSISAGLCLPGSNLTSSGALTSLDEERRERDILAEPLLSQQPHVYLLHSSAQNKQLVRPARADLRRYSTSSPKNASTTTKSRKKRSKKAEESQKLVENDTTPKLVAPEAESAAIESVNHEAEAIAYFEARDYNRVLDVFDSIRASGEAGVLSEKVYSLAIQSIIELSKSSAVNGVYDLAPALEIYSDMLQSHIKPSVDTYSAVISSLVEAAKSRSKAAKSLLYQSRGILTSVDADSEKLEQSSQYFALAFQIYDASNSVTAQKYTPQFYTTLLEATISSNNVDRAPQILQAMEHWGYSQSISSLTNAIIAYGKNQDINAAVEAYEQVNPLASQSSEHVASIYAALISAYFACFDAGSAVAFFNQFLQSSQSTTPESFQPVMGAVISGFAAIGDYESAWKWIQEAEKDASMPPINLASVEPLLTAVCIAGNASLAEEIFDYMASQKGFNSNLARCSYLGFALELNSKVAVFKGIRESQLRSGVWDHATLARVCQWLIEEGEIPMAMDVFQAQAMRVSDYASENGIQVSAYEAECLEFIITSLQSCQALNTPTILALTNSRFMSSAVFAKDQCFDLFYALWEDRETREYKQLVSLSKLILIDVLALHHSLIAAVRTAEFPETFVEQLTLKYSEYVNDLIDAKMDVSESFAMEISSCLQALGCESTLVDFEAFLNNQSQSSDAYSITSVSTAASSVAVDTETSSRIMEYARLEDGLHRAFEELDMALTRGEYLLPEAILTVLESAGLQHNQDIFVSLYNRLAGKNIPMNLAASWDLWAAVYRLAVQYCAESDYALAMDAYRNLLALGTSPDATGYGQLMANAPVNSHDEAYDALAMFSEAMSMNVQPNTFLYNVLLSKLSKARRLKEAMFYYNQMVELNVKRSSVTYGTMISACCRTGDEEFAKQLFNEMESSPYYVAKVAPFNIMLQYYVHTKRDKKSALEMYERLRKQGIKPSNHTYKLLIDMHSTIAPIDIQAADEVLKAIVADGSFITSQHYAALIFARGVGLGDLESAVAFYDSLTFNKRAKPDKLIFQALLESYVVNGQAQRTGKVLDDMVKYGVDLNACMANILIRGWASVDLAKSVGLFEHVLQRGIEEPSTFEAMVRSFIFHGDSESATNVVLTMEKSGYPEPVLSKVRNLVAAHSGKPELSDRFLLDSIFRQDSHRLIFIDKH